MKISIIHKYLILSFIFGFLPFIIQAQGFSTSLVGGLNLSQLEGDNLSGFNKPGLHVGMRTNYALKEKQGVSVEFLFQQKGSSSTLNFGSPGTTERITLNYLSLPLQFYLNEWQDEVSGYYIFRVEGGVVLNYLIDVSSTNSFFDRSIDQFREFDAGISLGVAYSVNKNMNINLRFERSFLKIYEDPISNIRGLQSYLLTFRLEYAL
jgi:hypothetical protein